MRQQEQRWKKIAGLVAIIECLQFLAREGFAFEGSTEGESNFSQLLQLRAKDRPELLVWLNRTTDKYTSHEIQNELIAILQGCH